MFNRNLFAADDVPSSFRYWQKGEQRMVACAAEGFALQSIQNPMLSM
jgi:hypothetical protein